MKSERARRRNRRGEGGKLRGEIVDAAARILESTGSEEAVTLRAIAREVGISAPSIYAHFEDREQIVAAVVEEAFTELIDALLAAAGTERDPVRKLRTACLAYLDFAAERPHRYRVLFGHASGAPLVDGTGRPGADAFGVLVGGIQDCVAAGRSASPDPYLDATAVWVGLHGLATLRAGAASTNFDWPGQDALIDRLVLGGARITD